MLAFVTSTAGINNCYHVLNMNEQACPLFLNVCTWWVKVVICSHVMLNNLSTLICINILWIKVKKGL